MESKAAHGHNHSKEFNLIEIIILDISRSIEQAQPANLIEKLIIH